MKQLGIASLICGAAAWVIPAVPGIGCMFGWLAPLLAIAAIVLGVLALGGEGRVMGIIGIVLGALHIVISIFVALIAGAFVCIYMVGIFGIIGGSACCSSASNIVLPLTLLAALGAVRLARGRAKQQGF